MTRLERNQVYGDYEILLVAGTGGMGIVYKARQRSLGRPVALKVIREEVARVPEYRVRFQREARLAASVDHPHVVSVYEVGDQDDLFLAMQWIDGDDVRQVIERKGRLEPDRAVAITTQLAGALDAVHGAGLVHRDVKPANVLLRRVGGAEYAYLTDFGVAKPSATSDQLTRTGWTVGTPGYLSPEQIRGHEPGPQSDLYALGCLFFEALTGRQPFIEENEMALRWAHANNPRPTASTVLPSLGTRYDHFFSVALAIDPGQRFASGGEFAAALTAALRDQDVGSSEAPTVIWATQATRPPASAPRRTSRKPLAVAIPGIIGLAAVAGALGATWMLSRQGATPTPAPTASPPTSRSAPATLPTIPSGTTPCGGGLAAGPKTSCGFARNIQQDYNLARGGDQDVTAYSPATGVTYTIHCKGDALHVCTGGNTKNASVYFYTSGTS